MFGIGMPELLIVLVLALIIFGAGKLPEIGAGLGKAISGFRKTMTDLERQEEESQAKKVKKGENPSDYRSHSGDE